MRLTPRDVRLVKDIGLSYVMSRDQIVSLGYFSSITRANTRIRALRALGVVRRIETPFFTQSLFVAGPRSVGIVGERIASILAGRTGSPRFIQHALCVNNVRLALLKKGATAWRFEQQLSTSFRFAGREYQVRPDGLAVSDAGLVAVEVDLGHVAPSKFREKLLGFDAFADSGECARQWHAPTFKVLTITTGKLRAKRLLRCVPPDSRLTFECLTFDQLRVPFIGHWS